MAGLLSSRWERKIKLLGREWVLGYLFESLAFFSLQMENTESQEAYIRSLGKL